MQYPTINYNENEYIYIYIYIIDSLCCIPEANTISKLYFNKFVSFFLMTRHFYNVKM